MNANDTNAAGAEGGPPVLLKNADGFEWPEDLPMFYLVARDGLYVCRNHDLFRSCVPANGGPRRLADQTSFLLPRFPRIPRELFEQSVGFFSRIADLHGSEAAALFYWDQGEQRVRLHVPDQVATVARYSDGYVSPIGVHYTPPTDLPDDWISVDQPCFLPLAATCIVRGGTDEPLPFRLSMIPQPAQRRMIP